MESNVNVLVKELIRSQTERGKSDTEGREHALAYLQSFLDRLAKTNTGVSKSVDFKLEQVKKFGRKQ